MSPMSSFKHIVCISNELPSMHTFPRTLCIMDSKAKDFHFFRFVFVLLYSLYCLVGNCPVAYLFLYFRTGCTILLTCTPCTFIPLYPCTLHSTLWVRVGWVYWVQVMLCFSVQLKQILFWNFCMRAFFWGRGLVGQFFLNLTIQLEKNNLN